MRILYLFFFMILAKESFADAERSFPHPPDDPLNKIVIVSFGGTSTWDSAQIRCPPSELHPKGFSSNLYKKDKRLPRIVQPTATSLLRIEQVRGLDISYIDLGLEETCTIMSFTYRYNDGGPGTWRNFDGPYKQEAFWSSIDGKGHDVILSPNIHEYDIRFVWKLVPKDISFPGQAIWGMESNGTWSGHTDYVFIIPQRYPQTIPGTFRRTWP